MATKLLDFWLYLYLGCIYFVPLVVIMRSKDTDGRFLLRKMLFPLELLNSTKIGAGDKLQPFSDKAGTYIYLVS